MSKRKAKPAKAKPARKRAPGTRQDAPGATRAPAVPEAGGRDEGFTDVDRAFALDYLANGFNATAAYQLTHPGAARNTCWSEGSKYLRKPKVAEFISVRLEAAWKSKEMQGNEAAGRLAELARAELPELLDEKGKLLDPDAWPADLRRAVKKYDAEKQTVELHDKQKALTTILQVTGKLKGEGETVDLLVAALTADLSRREAAK